MSAVEKCDQRGARFSSGAFTRPTPKLCGICKPVDGGVNWAAIPRRRLDGDTLDDIEDLPPEDQEV